jgi:hypothetical protein
MVYGERHRYIPVLASYRGFRLERSRLSTLRENTVVPGMAWKESSGESLAADGHSNDPLHKQNLSIFLDWPGWHLQDSAPRLIYTNYDSSFFLTSG